MTKQRKRRSQRRTRRKLHWPRLGDPIKFSEYDWSKKMALEEQYRRMLKLKEHFKIEGEIGYKPWYELALAIASKFDEGLRIVPEVQPDGPKAPRWKGAHRRQLEAELSAIQKQNPTRSPRWCWQQVFERSGRYGDMDFETFYKRVSE